jgi:hypothetical protein
MARRNPYVGSPVAVQQALQLAYDLRAEIKKNVRKDLKRGINAKIVGKQELDQYIVQCNPKAPRRRREAWWYEAVMQRLIDTVLALRSENTTLRREVGRAARLDEVHVYGEDVGVGPQANAGRADGGS